VRVGGRDTGIPNARPGESSAAGKFFLNVFFASCLIVYMQKNRQDALTPIRDFASRAETAG